MASDLNVSLRIRAITEGLQNISKLIGELDGVGAATGAYEKEADQLNAELKQLAQEQDLIQAFRKSKAEIQDTGRAIEKAKEQAAKLAREFKTAEQPTKKLTQQFEQAKKRVRELAAAEQKQKLELQELRKTMDKAGLSTKRLADQQRRAKQEMDAAKAKVAQLEQTLTKAKGRMKETGAAGARAGRKIKQGMRDGAEGAGTLKDAIASARAQLLALLSVAGAMRLARNLTENTDAWKQYQAQLKLVTGSAEEQARAEEALFDISQDTRSELEGSIRLYARLGRVRKDLNLGQQQLLDLTELVAQAFKVSGASQVEAAAATQQLSQALASGVLRGDEFNSIMENGTRIAQALADGLDVPIGQLRAMAEAGELTAGRVTAALLSQKETIEGEYSALPLTIEGSLTRISNAWQRYIGEADEAAGASSGVAEGLSKIAEHFEEIADLALAAGQIIIGVFAVKGVNALRAFDAEALLAKGAVGALGLELGAATGKLGKLQTAANLALSGFVGWEIGSYLREQFVEVERAGIAMAAGLTRSAEYARYAYESTQALFTDDTLEAAAARHEQRLKQIDDTYFDIFQGAGKAAEGTKAAAAGIEKTGAAAAGAGSKLGGFKGDLAGTTAEAGSLSEALKGLGTDLQELRTGITANERTLIESFTEVATSVDASSEVIVGAYRKAVDQAESIQTLRALNDSLIQSYEEGQISASDYALALEFGIKKINDSADAHRKSSESIEREIQTLRQEADLRRLAGGIVKQDIANRRDLARARGDENEAARLTRQLLREESRQAREAAQVQRELAQKLRDLAAARLQAAKAAQTQGEGIGVVTEAEQAEVDAINNSAQAAELKGKALEQSAQASSKAANETKKVAGASKQASKATEELAQTTSAAGTITAHMMQVMESMLGALGRYSQSAERAARATLKAEESWSVGVAKIGEMSRAAKQFVRDDPIADIKSRIVELGEGADEAGRIIERLGEHALATTATWKPWYDGLAQIARFEQALARAAQAEARTQLRAEKLGQAITDLQNRFEAGELGLREYTERVERLQGSYRGLGDERLQPLREALEDARQRTEALRDSAQSALETALQAAGADTNAREIETLRYKRLQLDLEEQLQEAREAGDAEAASDLQRAIRLQQEAHRGKLRQIEEERNARRQAAAEDAKERSSTGRSAPRDSVSTAPVRTTRVEISLQGRRTSLDLPEGQDQDLLDVLRRSQLSSA